MISKGMINFSTLAIKYGHKAVGNQENHTKQIINTTNSVCIFSIQLLIMKQQIKAPQWNQNIPKTKKQVTVYYLKKIWKKSFFK